MGRFNRNTTRPTLGAASAWLFFSVAASVVGSTASPSAANDDAAGDGSLGPAPGVVAIEGATMGTRYHAKVVVTTPEAFDVAGLKAAIDGRLAELNQVLSTYEPESELSRFNRSPPGEWFPVSADLAAVASFALKTAEESGGAFDPTVGPLVNLWGFGPLGRRETPPTDEEIAVARRVVGYRAVTLRADPPALKKTSQGVYLDFSAIAKGYASDDIGRLITELGDAYLRDAPRGEGAAPLGGGYMIEIGGEVATRGTKPGGGPWKIGLQRPDAAAGELSGVAELRDEALATSGDYRNFFEAGGQSYSHTIDPLTGRPVTHNLAAVTVRAATCMEADAVATALLVMGPGRGYDWAEERGVAALLIERTENGPAEKTTTAWQAVAADAEPADSEPASGGPTVMQVFFVTLAAFAVALGGMAIGVLISNRRIKGSCGGLAGFKDGEGNSICDACTSPSPECRGEPNDHGVAAHEASA
ncbi:MAG: FAD:protein FMN transferase [Planctomycetota bacterium]